jgi:AcrR family transcriptional regulator
LNIEPTAGNFAPLELPPPPDPDPLTDPLVGAVVAEVVESGYENATIAGLLRRAGVSLESFHARFETLEACALDSYERLIADFERRVGSSFNRQRDWPTALRAAAYTCVDWMVERPGTMAFGSAEVLKMPSELARVRREEVTAFCAELIDRGREAAPDPASIPESAPIFAVGAIVQLLTLRVQEGKTIQPYEVIPETMHRIVSIYLGPEAAEAEWSAPRPRDPAPSRR